MKAKILVGLSVLLTSGVTYAACPDSLSPEKMMDCLNIEKAGRNYQEEMMKAESDEMVSPITGTDVRTIQPAAGGADATTETTTDDKTE